MAKKVEKKEEKGNSRVNSALALLRKKFGDDSAMTFDNVGITKIDVIPSGSLKLDKILGIGGWPRGRITLLWGDYSSGKSTVCLQAVANAQKQGLVCAYVDMEHALDPIYAENLGCNMSELILLQPDGGEQALEAIKLMAQEKAVDLIILDSIVACVPESELEGELADSNIGKQAKLFSSFFKQVTPAIEKANITLICTNQVRLRPGGYGNPEVLPCGEAQKFYASIICRTRRQASQKEETSEGIIANQISVHVEKNKLAPPFRKAELMIYYGKGFSADNEMFDMAVEFNIIEKAGGWFKYNGENIGQGSVKAKAWLESHEDVKQIVMDKVKEILMRPNNEKMTSEESELDYDPETGEVFE